MALQATGVADLVTNSLNDLGELKMTDNMTAYQNTTFLKRLVKRGKMTFQAGPELQFNRILDTNGSARGVGLFYTAQVNAPNIMGTGKVGWRHATWNWTWDRREIAMNRTPRKINDMLKTRRIGGLASGVVYFERRGWRCPAINNDVDFFGIPYWVVKSTTAASTANNDGFNGLAPSGYTLVGNIDPSSDLKWRNYTDVYVSVTKDDLIPKLWRAADYTDFMPIVDEIPQYNVGDDYGWYTAYSIRDSMKRIAEAQNDNLGFDMDPSDGKVTFRRAPVVWVKELDADTDLPMYCINWGLFHCAGLSGEWMHETQIPFHHNQPSTGATHTDCTINTICHDRRRQAVLAVSASYTG